MLREFSISPHFVSDDDIILIEFLLNLLEKQTNATWALIDNFSSDIAIIDIDHAEGLALYKGITNKSGKPVAIAMSVNTGTISEEFTLTKPLRSASFLSVIKSVLEKAPELSTDLSVNYEATEDLIKEPSPQPTEEADADFDPFSSVLISSAIKKSSVKRLYNQLADNFGNFSGPVELSYHGVNLYIDPTRKHFLFEHKLMMLSMLCKADFEKIQIRDISDNELKQIENNIQQRPISVLTWYSVLLGSSGELMDKLYEYGLIRLKRWPNPELVSTLPKHMASRYMMLSGFMMKHTAALAEISKQTNIKPEEVIDFVNACSVMGYLFDDPDMFSGNKTSADNRDKNKQSLFGKLRSRFGLKSD